MACTTGRIGTSGTFLRTHEVEPNNRLRVLSQDRARGYLPAQAHPAPAQAGLS
jgi:hypothetical protein